MESSRESVRNGSHLYVAVRQQAFRMYQERHWTNAEILLKGLLCAEPEDAWSVALYGSVLREQGQYREGLGLLDRAAALAPHDTHIREMRDELREFVNRSH